VAAAHKLDGLIAWTPNSGWREPPAHWFNRHTVKAGDGAGIDAAEIEIADRR
jgi:hypothetical protein